MEREAFTRLFHEQVMLSEDVLVDKARQYATEDDQLHNFKTAALLQGITTREALAGMMAKHTVSIYDMIRDDREFPLEMWLEKITDHINFLILLRAVVTEDLLRDQIDGVADNLFNEWLKVNHPERVKEKAPHA